MAIVRYPTLITGCGRSGTTFISRLLTTAGLDFRHHNIGDDGGADWCLAVDGDVELPWGDPGRRSSDFVFDVTLHQVRDPLAVIGSFGTATQESWEYIYRFTSARPEDSTLRRSMIYWLEWNRLAEQKAAHTYRIEDLAQPIVWKSFCGWIDHPELVDRADELFGAVETTANSRRAKYDAIRWDDLEREDRALASSIRRASIEYGYDYGEVSTSWLSRIRRRPMR